MSETKKKFYLTTPIYYVNARPHIGHAYTTIAADVIARRHRLLGEDTFFLTGTDEHGQKIERSANAAGIPPQQFADQVSAQFESLWKRMGITNDDYIRTTEPRHKRGVQKLFSLLQQNGFIELRSYTGQYCISDETFVDVPVGAPCPECGRLTETVTEENYFFKLSHFQRQLIDLIESDTLAIQPNTRKNEVLSFLRGNASDGDTSALSAKDSSYVPGALKDLSISRSSFKWGIPVPGDEKHVVYVWLDALANYMTAIGYGSDDPADQEKFNKYWPADLHLVGKEIIRFHCVYWPAFLLASGLPLPKAITAHGWLLFENDKMSKSKGNIVRTETILDAFGSLKPEATKEEQDLFASDVLRYFLLREIPFGQDGSFSFDALVQRYNSDLANGYANLVSRALAMIQKNFNGEFTAELGDHAKAAGSLTLETGDFSLPSAIIGRTLKTTYPESLAEYDFGTALGAISASITGVDKYFSDSAPWKLTASAIQADREKLAEILYLSSESIRIITALLYPILPYATSKVWAQLGLGSIEQAAANGELKDLQWGGLKPGTKLGPLSPIFPRAPKELIQIMTDMEQNSTAQKSVHPTGLPHINNTIDNPAHEHTEFREAPISSVSATPAMNPIAESTHPITDATVTPDTPQIAIDDFAKIDLRVARILVAERIPKADKLLRLEVDLGYEKRQILSGIAQWYTPEELIGRRIVVIANLAPRKMRGLESHGMLLAASHNEDGKPILATFNEEIALGSRLH
jgi:methionyl-tRNA synthetase